MADLEDPVAGAVAGGVEGPAALDRRTAAAAATAATGAMARRVATDTED
jgi:hypothetical protein